MLPKKDAQLPMAMKMLANTNLEPQLSNRLGIGIELEVSLQSKIKQNADHAGLSPLLEQWNLTT